MNFQPLCRTLTATRLLIFASLTAVSVGVYTADAQNLATAPTLSTGGVSESGTLSPFSYQFSADGAFIGRGSVDLGRKEAGIFKEGATSATFVLSAQLSNSF